MYRFGIEIGKLGGTAITPQPKYTQTYPGGFPACIGFTITTVYFTPLLPEGLLSTMTKTTAANIIARAATTKKTMNVSLGYYIIIIFVQPIIDRILFILYTGIMDNIRTRVCCSQYNIILK